MLMAAAIGAPANALADKPNQSGARQPAETANDKHERIAKEKAEAEALARKEKMQRQEDAIREYERQRTCPARKAQHTPEIRVVIPELNGKPIDFANDVVLGPESDVFSSTDGGSTWSRDVIPDGAEPTAIDVSEGYVIVGRRGLILRKANIEHKGKAAKQWQLIASGTSEHLYDIRFWRQYGLIVGANGTALHSQDYGQTWHKTAAVGNPALSEILVFELGYADVKTVDGRVFRTVDMGRTWEELKTSQTGEPSHVRTRRPPDPRYFAEGDSGWSIVTPRVYIPPIPCGRAFTVVGRSISSSVTRRSGW